MVAANDDRSASRVLNFIYYPVSWIMRFWHQVFGYVIGANSGFAWALSVVFLVFTLRLVLYVPFVKQVRTTRQMQELQPQIKALQAKYKNDRQTLAVEMQKLQREHGFNPLMGCLPVLLQAPVFIGLYHVLRSFNRTTKGFGPGHLGMSITQNANTANYAFSVKDVQSFLGARIFGAPMSAAITTPKKDLQAFVIGNEGLPHVLNMALVAIPLMIIAGLATHFNARASVARQSAAAQANPQAAMMNKLALWVFPVGVLVGGPFLPIAILLYWVSNNIWTYGQQHFVFAKIDREEKAKAEKAKEAAQERRAVNTPKPGAKPGQQKKIPAAEPAVEDAAGEVEDSIPPGQQSTNGSTPKSTTPKSTPKSTPKRKPAGSGSGGGGQKRSGNRGRANQRKRR
jgi:YidC/Oxa1 family membrane protein insertase